MARKIAPAVWQMVEFAGNYAPEPAGRRVIRLDEIATGLLASIHRGRNSKFPMYAWINWEGDVRRRQPLIIDDWEEALTVGLNENLCIYNARSKKACRPIWRHPAPERTLQNMTFEEVRLIPHEKTYFHTLPAVNAKIFEIEP